MAQEKLHSIVEQRNQDRFGFSVWVGVFRGRFFFQSFSVDDWSMFKTDLKIALNE